MARPRGARKTGAKKRRAGRGKPRGGGRGSKAQRRKRAAAAAITGTETAVVARRGAAAPVVPVAEPAPPVAIPVEAPAPAAPPVPMPKAIFFVALLWMLVLTAAFLVGINVDGFRELLPPTLGPLPPETIWFGAVGGMLISFAGIYRYNRDWDPKFDYWHYTRPLLGAFMGVLGCLALILLTELSTTTDEVSARPAVDATFYALVALVVGYREESFRTLIRRLTDVLLMPGRTEETPARETRAGRDR